MNFNQLCKKAESLSPLEYSAIIASKTAKIIPALHEICDDYIDTAKTFASFLMASIFADGKLDENEYLLILPSLKLVFGDEVSYEDAKALAATLRPESRELKAAVDEMVDILGLVSDELKDDIITVCLLVCAIDGKISAKEKRYIKQLIR